MTDPNMTHATSDADTYPAAAEPDLADTTTSEKAVTSRAPEPIALLRRIRAHVALRSQTANSAVLIAQGFNPAGIALARAYTHYGRRVIVIGERPDLAPLVQSACVKAIVMPMSLGHTDNRSRLIDSMERSFPAMDTLIFAGDAAASGSRNYISERDLIDDAAAVVLGPTALAEWYLSGCRVTTHRSVLASISPAPTRTHTGKHDALARAMAQSLHGYVRGLARVLDARRVEVLALPHPRGAQASPQLMKTASLNVRSLDRWGLRTVRNIENARMHSNKLLRLFGNAKPNPD
jgi:hypothetical protein